MSYSVLLGSGVENKQFYFDAPVVSCKRFSDRDQHIQVPEVEGDTVFYINSLYPDQDSKWIETFLTISRLNEYGKTVIPIFTFFSYGRQDKRKKEDEALSAYTMLDLLFSLGVEKMGIVNAHFIKKKGKWTYKNLEVENLDASGLIKDYLRGVYPDIIFMSPDKGAEYMTGNALHKERGDYEESDISERKISKMTGGDDSVKGKTVGLVDDMIAGGDTMKTAIDHLKSHGAKTIVCAAVHGQFVGNAIEKLSGSVIVCTDSLESDYSVVSINGLISGFIKNSQ